MQVLPRHDPARTSGWSTLGLVGPRISQLLDWLSFIGSAWGSGCTVAGGYCHKASWHRQHCPTLCWLFCGCNPCPACTKTPSTMKTILSVLVIMAVLAAALAGAPLQLPVPLMAWLETHHQRLVPASGVPCCASASSRWSMV